MGGAEWRSIGIKSPRYQDRHTILTPCGDYYQIPFRCLLPRGMANLLVVGRTVSSTFLARGSLRVMATCMSMGQACFPPRTIHRFSRS